MHAALILPPGLSQRALVLGDAAAVAALTAAQELHDVGESTISEADVRGDWQRPSFDLATSTVGVFNGDELVAYGEIGSASGGEAAVHPAWRRRGLGTAIAGWMEASARARRLVSVGGEVAEGSDGDRLLESLGYDLKWISWQLAFPAGAELPRSELPPGFTVRPAEPDQHEACWTVAEDAFLTWARRPREPLADWLARVTGRPGFEPWNLRVVADSGGEIVGVAVVQLDGDTGFIAKLATRADHRGRGLGLALLTDSFAAAFAHGATRAALSTDSRSGALSLYMKAGMQVTSTWRQREVDLTSRRDDEGSSTQPMPDDLDDARYSAMRWNTPLSEVHAERLLDQLDLRPGQHLVDLGCGWGELLLRAVARAGEGASGLGIDSDEPQLDRGRIAAAAAGLGGQVTFAAGQAADWKGVPDRALCIGASQAWGTVETALQALASHVQPGGLALFGEDCWQREPTPAAVAMFPEVLPLSALLAAARDAGWRLLHLSTADQSEWDEFESTWRLGRERWLAANPSDDRAAEVRATLNAQLADYVGGYRGVLGFAYLVLQRAA